MSVCEVVRVHNQHAIYIDYESQYMWVSEM